MAMQTGTFLGPYEILGLVGSGGMGEVYRARDKRLGRLVAVKVLPATTAKDHDRLSRFEREARMASSLNHPNIVTIYDVGEENSVPFIAMELVDGRTLRDFISSGNTPLREIVSIAVQIADALAKAHELGIVHRDLKPENVMISGDGVVKVLDFGLGKNTPIPVGVSDSTVMAVPNPTNPGTILGTADYMSPEQAAGRETDFHSDQFSLGSIIYEMVAQQRPFRRDTVAQTMAAIIAEPAPTLSSKDGVPQPLADVVSRCLQKTPQKRYASTRDLTAELRELSVVLEAGDSKLTLKLSNVTHKLNTADPRERRVKVIVVVVLMALVLGVALTPRARNAIIELVHPLEPLPVSKNLVVLPFRASDTDAQHQSFAAGLAETITTTLTQLTLDRSLQMSPASEVVNRHVANSADARRVLAANLVLTGIVETNGDRLSLLWNVEDPSTNHSLRSGTISVKASEPMDLESKAVEIIAGSLGLNVTPNLKATLSEPTTTVAAAKDAYLRGRGYLQNYDKAENVSRAIELFREAEKFDPNYAQAYAASGEAYWRQSQYSRTNEWIAPAQQNCEKAIALNAKMAAGHGCLGTVYFGIGRYEDALKEYRIALDAEPTSDNFRREAARTEEKLGRPRDAEKTLKEAIQFRPQYWANYNVLGGFYFNQARYTEAASMFSEVVKLAPDTAFGYANLGGTYSKLGRYTEALPMFERAALIRPTGTAYSNLATTQFQMGNFLDAAATFEKATAVDEKNYAVWGNLGDAYYFAAGRREQSVFAYKKAIELGEEQLRVNSRDAILLSRIALYYSMLNQQTSASSYLKRALDIAPNDPEVRFKAALIHNQLKEDSQTLEWLEKAAQAGYSITTIRDIPNFNHLWGFDKFRELIRKY